MEYIAPTFDSVPSDKELEELLEFYHLVYGVATRKVGVTSKTQFSKRYSKNTIYNKLTEESVFCETINGEVALGIEAKMMRILRQRGICANAAGDSELATGCTVKTGQEYYVYLTEKKDNEDKCQMCGKIWISGKEQQRKYIEEIHWEEVMVFTQAIKNLEAKEEDNSKLIAEYKSLLKWRHIDEEESPKPSTSEVSKTSTVSSKPSSSASVQPSSSGSSRKRNYTRIKPISDDDDSD